MPKSPVPRVIYSDRFAHVVRRLTGFDQYESILHETIGEYDIGEQVKPTIEDLSDHEAVAARAVRLGLEQWGDLTEPWRDPGQTDGEASIRAVGAIHYALMNSLDRLLAANPPRVAEFLQQLAESSSPIARFSAAMRIDVAFFANPETARPLISTLLTDEDGRVRMAAHDNIAFFAEGATHGERGEDEARGFIPVDYLVSLPIHHLEIASHQGARTTKISSGVTGDFWPVP